MRTVVVEKKLKITVEDVPMKDAVIVFFLLFQLLLTSCQSTPSPENPIPTEQILEPYVSQQAEETFLPEPEYIPDAPTQPEFDPVVLARTLTLEEQVGQIFLARCPETEALEDIQTYHLGGYVLFGRDFKNDTPESVVRKLEEYQSASSIPLLLAVDEEGGSVTRISYYPAYRERKFP